MSISLPATLAAPAPRIPPGGTLAPSLALAALGLAPHDGMALRLAVLGGFTLLMLAAAWITFPRSEANT